MIRMRHVVTGQVQGVGFRPFIYRLALDHCLTGFVCNTPDGVVIEVQGEPASIASFERDLPQRLPPLAHIIEHTSEPVEVRDKDEAFVIHASVAGEGHRVLVSPDIATCPDCLADMRDEKNRRLAYPFTNCTNCGPRYTITRSIPYDRESTSMACFPLCPDCRNEYENPLDRRFHAQPNACPVCGPQVWLADHRGETIVHDNAALVELALALCKGVVAAIKGLGGFHLAVDARNDTAVSVLRQRKKRPAKPLAIMVASLDVAHEVAHISHEEEAILTGRERPVVLLRKRADAEISTHVAPHTPYIGVMLAYTPLHHALFWCLENQGVSKPPVLVMTSGNAGGEPICLGNREALSRLSGFADLFLFHNRDILVRVDDSVTRVVKHSLKAKSRTKHESNTSVQFLRRARGYTPSPIFLGRSGPEVLGLGPELKTTVCFTKDNQAFLSQHIGDMSNLETYGFYKEVIAHLRDMLMVEPQAVVCDMHPDYLTTAFAHEQTQWPIFRLQHHFAHLYAVMAENACYDKAVGLCLDGTGYGTDGTIWGGECLVVDPSNLEHTRFGHLDHIRLPGGEAAIREPWRIARAVLADSGDHEGEWPWMTQFRQADAFVQQMLDRDIRCPKTSSCGRLFDAVSALLGVCLEASYEGQAAIMLEAIQEEHVLSNIGAYPCPVVQGGEYWQLESRVLLRAVLEDIKHGVAPSVISRRFHLGLAEGLAELASLAAQQHGTSLIGLSGGVMLNRTLHVELCQRIKIRKLTPLLHIQSPPGDGCISLGQALYGRLCLGKSR